MRKKTQILIFIMMSFLILSGWGKKEVKLLDSSKLIDLSVAIDLAKPGGMTGDSNEGGEADLESDGNAESVTNFSNHDNIRPKEIIIHVIGENITYTRGNNSLVNVTIIQLQSKLRSDYSPDVQVILRDDYAEAHVYRRVRDVLTEMKNEMGLSFLEDQGAGGNEI